ncbi:hypothetical protein PCANB_002057 [Pneumocystis canis]|nr:hypothetical protein PCK1_001872 [Pneumocystis canis]KAG5439483.1 hypothetical protein PCANB_002057 [Pneumocystis canis]
MYRFSTLQMFYLFRPFSLIFPHFRMVFEFYQFFLIRRGFGSSTIYLKKKLYEKSTISDVIIKESFNDKEILSFKYKISNHDLDAALESYTELNKTGCLTGYDVAKLVSLIHYSLKITLKSPIDHYRTKFLLSQLENILNDIYIQCIPGHPMIWVNAINVYTNLGLYETGKNLWNHIKSKYLYDSSSFDSRVFGAAIKLYSAMGFSLADSEALFQEAINVHNMKESLILYEGIIMARIQNQDKERALEGLQECLDKFRDVIKPKFFDFLIYTAINKNISKSVVEIVLYCLNLRYLPSPEALTKLFKQLWIYDQDLLTILKIFTKYVEVANNVHIEHLNFILITMFKLTNKNDQNDIKNMTDKVNGLLNFIYKMNISPSVSTFNTLISGFTFLEQFDQVERILQEMKRLEVSENQITLRILLKMHGKKGSSLQEISIMWEKIVELSLKNTHEFIQERDWLMFLKAVSPYGKQGIDLIISFLQKYRLQVHDSVFQTVWQKIIELQ